MASSKTDHFDPIANMMRELSGRIIDWAEAKQWYTPGQEPREPAMLLMLITTELAEACEAFREGNPPCQRDGMDDYTHAEEELADAIIRILQMGEEFGFDVPGAVMAKMRFNWTRASKHGKQF